MKRIGLAILVLVGLGGVLYLALADPGVQDSAPIAEARGEEPGAPQTSTLGNDENHPGRTHRTTLDASAAPSPAPAKRPNSFMTLTGRCVMRGSEEPASGCEIHACRSRTLSGPDGTFSIEVDGQGNHSFEVTVQRHDLCGIRGSISLKRGQTRDLGDIPMIAGTPLEGTVLDTAGKRVANASFKLSTSILSASAGGWNPAWPPVSAIDLRTTSDGSFRAPFAMWPGSYRIQCFPHVLVHPHTIDSDSRTSEPLTIQVQRRNPREMISGRIYDPSGQPVVGNVVMILGAPLAVSENAGQGEGRVQNTTTRRLLGRTTTDAHGAFTFLLRATVRKPEDAQGAWVESAPTAQFQRLTSPRIPWGSLDARLVLSHHNPKSTAARVRVVDDQEEAVALFDAILHEIPSEQAPYRSRLPQRVLGSGKAYPGGEIKLPPLGDGRYVLHIKPKSRPALADLYLTLEFPRDRGQTITGQLKPQLRFTIQVVDQDNKPVVGSQLEIFGVANATTVLSLFRESGRTDQRGQFTFPRPRQLQHFRVSVLGSKPKVSKIIPKLTSDDLTCRIQVNKGTKWRGRIVPLERWQDLSRKGAFISFQTKRGEITERSEISPAADGTFQTELMGTGPHVVTVCVQAPSGALRTQLTDPVRIGGSGEITIDVSDVSVGSIRGQLLTNGTPRPNYQFSLVYEGLTPLPKDSERPDSIPRAAQFVSTDAKGRFRLRGLSGVYHIRSKTETSSPVTLVPGDQEWVFKTQRRILVIQLTDAAGQPRAGVREVETNRGLRTSDARGRLEFALKPDMTVLLYHLQKTGGRRTSGPFKIKSDSTRTKIQVRWPPER